MVHVVAMLILLLYSARAASAQTVEVLATDPEAQGPGDRAQAISALALDEAVYVRLSYTSSTPVRFQARGSWLGVEVMDGARMNPAPVYPAGTGEALVWVAYIRPATIDEVVIQVADANWNRLGTERLALRASWHSAGVVPPRAGWVGTLNASQQQMVSAALASANDSDGLLGIVLLPLLFLSAPAYPVLQIWAGLRWKGRWRALGLLPLAVSVPLVIYTMSAFAAGSNIWPLVMIFTLPFVCAYLMLLAVARRVYAGR